jgi:hypothetical protein
VTKVFVVGITLCLLAPTSGAVEVEDQIRSACRWIDSEETFPATLLTRITATGDDAMNTVEGVSTGCSIVLACLLEARAGARAGGDDEAGETDSIDPASLCWRVTDIERLSKETLDRMVSHLDASGARATARGDDGPDPDPAACGRFLRCLSRSGIGETEDRSWRDEFARICAMTDVVDTLSREELQSLIEDSERLLGVLEHLSAPEAKVYIFRLKMCRDLFGYSLQLLESDAPAAGEEASPE